MPFPKCVVKHPTKQEIEKVAQEIVIHVRRTGEDPYSSIKDTGFPPNILETLLRKFNIFNFLHDFESHDDPQNRDVGSPPLSLDKLFSSGDCATPGIRGVIIRKKINIPMDQACDAHALTKSTCVCGECPNCGQKTTVVGDPLAEKKIADAEIPPQNLYDLYDEYSTSKLKAAHQCIADEIYREAHTYHGYITKIATLAEDDTSILEELSEVHDTSPVTFDIFKCANVEKLPPSNKKWILQKNEKLASAITRLEKHMTSLREKQKELYVLATVLHQRGEQV